jgi:AIPR protein/abortive infection phage resistance-like protein
VLTLDEYARSFTEDVLAEAEEAEEGAIQEDVFTQHAADVVTEAGEAVDPQICQYRGRGMRVSAYDYLEDSDELDLFVSDFSNSDRIRNISTKEIGELLDRGRGFLSRSMTGLWQQLEESTEAHDLAQLIHAQKDTLRSARVILLTNRLAPRKVDTDEVALGEIRVTHEVWDIERLYQVAAVSLTPTPISVDLASDFGGSIACIRMPGESPVYEAYLAVIPAPVLAEIYGRWGQRLLQRNVRSFLQARGSVNKGIRDTLDKSPDMFLAYNNGISATAERVELEQTTEGPRLAKLTNLQIVNGGQTTASVYNAFRSKGDLSKAFVQMKLTVLRDPERIDEIVHLISLYANSQTKIAFSDFSANDPFHIELEKLSRQIWAPKPQGKATTMWFYERARGQYLDERSRQDTLAKKRTWELQHPPKQKLTKSLVAKYEMAWHQYPHWVSEGAEKNFARFSGWLQENPIQVDQLYFEHLVAKAIVFQDCDAAVRKMDLGGYKANVVAYSIAWMSYLMGATFNLERVWLTQTVTDNTRGLFIQLARKSFEHITNPPGRTRNVTEWAKKEDCWLSLRDQTIKLGDVMSELIKPSRQPIAANGEKPIRMGKAENLQLEQEVMGMRAQDWYRLARWMGATGKATTWERNFVTKCALGVSRDREISAAQMPHALRIYMDARAEGFTLEHSPT